MSFFTNRNKFHNDSNPNFSTDFSEYKPFSTISKLFLLYGIDIEICNKSSRKTIIIWVFRIFSVFVWTLIISMKICSFRKHKDIKIISSAIFRRTLELNGIILLWIMYCSRKEITSIIQEIQKLAQVSKALPSQIFQYCIFAWVIVVEIFLTYSRHNRRIEKCFVKVLNPVIPYVNEGDLENSRILFIFLNAVCVSYAYVFPCTFVGLYLLLCKHLENILLKYSKKNLAAISQDINHDLFYKKIKIYSLIL